LKPPPCIETLAPYLVQAFQRRGLHPRVMVGAVLCLVWHEYAQWVQSSKRPSHPVRDLCLSLCVSNGWKRPILFGQPAVKLQDRIEILGVLVQSAMEHSAGDPPSALLILLSGREQALKMVEQDTGKDLRQEIVSMLGCCWSPVQDALSGYLSSAPVSNPYAGAWVALKPWGPVFVTGPRGSVGGKATNGFTGEQCSGDGELGSAQLAVGAASLCLGLLAGRELVSYWSK